MINSDKRVVFSKQRNLYTINVTDFIKKLFGDIITKGLIICPDGFSQSDAQFQSWEICNCANSIGDSEMDFMDAETLFITFTNGKTMEINADKFVLSNPNM